MSNNESSPASERILQIASGFMASKHLFMASEMGIFQRLGDGPKSLDDLAKATKVDKRSIRIVADAMVALGLLERTAEGNYKNAGDSQFFLSGTTPADLRPLLKFWDRLSYRNWARFDDAIYKRTSTVEQPTPENQEIFSKGVEAITTPQALGLSRSYDFGKHKAVADLGGGTGSFLLPILSEHGSLECILFELPETANVARRVLSKNPLGSKIKVVDGDLFKDDIPTGIDCLILANVIHLFSGEHNLDLLMRIRKQASRGTRLLLVDFWTDPTHTVPPMAAILAGEFLTVSGEGDVYSLAEIQDWLSRSGWRFIEHRQIGGPAGLVVAEA